MFASNSHQVFRPSMQNENPVLPMKNSTMGTSKTPAASSKQRRALGDISNRKQGGVNGGGGKVTLAPKKTPGLRLQQQPQRNPLSTKTPKLSKNKKEVAFLPRPTQVIKPAPSVNILPDLGANKSANQRPVQKSLLKNKQPKTVQIVSSAPVDDIERPAGRLWVEQQDDDDSCTSLSLPEYDWEASFKKRHQIRLKQNKEEEARDEAEYNKYIENFSFDDDESSAMIGADVWIERTLSFDIDLEEELSFGAPSFCGDISF